jgi:hypothetical protein
MKLIIVLETGNFESRTIFMQPDKIRAIMKSDAGILQDIVRQGMGEDNDGEGG